MIWFLSAFFLQPAVAPAPEKDVDEYILCTVEATQRYVKESITPEAVGYLVLADCRAAAERTATRILDAAESADPITELGPLEGRAMREYS
ncbi:MAG: hypothetical protein JO095_03605, partial [Alphaproteobacteria bacterium]|nr:hypothetical protein [Alphaproteobacteria bacterium]